MSAYQTLIENAARRNLPVVVTQSQHDEWASAGSYMFSTESAAEVGRRLPDIEGERVGKKRKGYTPPMVLSAGSVPLALGQLVPVIFSTYGQVEIAPMRVVAIARGTGRRVANDERDGEPCEIVRYLVRQEL